MDVLLVTLFSYLSGSIPFGLILTKLFSGQDVRKIGSGNIGATNVLRTGNKFLASLTLILDILKGYLPVVLTQQYFPELIQFSCLLAFLGHIFPIWLKFNGGKGVATFLGVMLAINWPSGSLCCLTWLVVAQLLRYSSVAALVAALAGPGYAYYFGNWQIMELAAFMTLLVFIRHHQNIRRLIRGEEPKIGTKEST